MAYTLSGFEQATGKIDYTLTNDYMFRAILQTNEEVLRGLIGALLHLHLEEIQSVTIENPIVLGAPISNKDFILDIRVLLNNNMVINLEMQVMDTGNWTDRSLLYLCRCFDRLQKGQTYDTVLPAIHIGILDFTLFDDDPQFYATNKMMNVKSHKVFNDKFTLNVLSLKQIARATDEDKLWQIDTWAELFAAKTWRDIKMIAKNNEILSSATESLYQLNADTLVREQCQAREDFEKHERTQRKQLADLKKTVHEQADTINELADTINEQADTINEQADTIIEKDSQIQDLNKEIASLKAELNKIQHN